MLHVYTGPERSPPPKRRVARLPEGLLDRLTYACHGGGRHGGPPRYRGGIAGGGEDDGGHDDLRAWLELVTGDEPTLRLVTDWVGGRLTFCQLAEHFGIDRQTSKSWGLKLLATVKAGWIREVAQVAHAELTQAQGGTIDPWRIRAVRDVRAYAVGKFGYERRVPAPATVGQIEAYVADVQRDLFGPGNVCLGLWRDRGVDYLDVVELYDKRAAALAAGRRNRQRAITLLSPLDTIWIEDEEPGREAA